MKHSLVVLALTPVFLISARPAGACLFDAEESIRAADAAFVARVERFTHYKNGPHDGQEGVIKLKLRVLSVQRGNVPSSVIFRTSDDSCSAVWADEGEEVGLVLVNEDGQLAAEAGPGVPPELLRQMAGPGSPPESGELVVGDIRPSIVQWVVHVWTNPWFLGALFLFLYIWLFRLLRLSLKGRKGIARRVRMSDSAPKNHL